MDYLSSPASKLLGRLEGVRAKGHNRWVARCPAHGDRTPSLAVTARDDGALLLRCFAGCSVAEVVGAVGLDLADLFPPQQPGVHASKPSRRPFSAEQILSATRLELMEVVVIIGAIQRRGLVTDGERARLHRSVSRLMVAGG